MIPEHLQDQAALYAMDALPADERAEFETALRADAELRELVSEMMEAAADLALSVSEHQPPSDLKQRVLRDFSHGQTAGKTHSPAFSWIPWAMAALFLIVCGILAVDRSRLTRDLAAARAVDPLSKAEFVALASPDGSLPEARATVAWEPDRQSGVITIRNLKPAGSGRDYQLWAVDAKHPDPLDGGVIHVGPNGITRVRFKPRESASDVKAFAISLERTGGVPKREGPIILIGKS